MNPRLLRHSAFVSLFCLLSTACGGGSYGTGTRPVQLTEGPDLTQSQSYSILGFATQCSFKTGSFGPGYALSVADQRGPIAATLLKSEVKNGEENHRCLAHISGKQENLRLRITPISALDDNLKYTVGAEACDGSAVPLPWRTPDERVTLQSGFISLPSLHNTQVQRLRIWLWFGSATKVELVLENDDLNCLEK